MFDAPPAWFRDEVHTLISRGDIAPEEGLLTMIHPPDWAFGSKPAGAGTTAPEDPMDSKVCLGCGLVRSLDDFYVKPNGCVRGVCRSCEVRRARERRAKASAYEKARLPCRSCGGPKEPGKGRTFCNACVEAREVRVAA